MKKVLHKFLFLLIAGVLVISCIDENNYTPPTQAEERALLREYLDTLTNRGLDIDTTEMGVYYIIDSLGSDTFPAYGDTCSVLYTGFLINGTIFDSSYGQEFKFTIGDERLIPGWNDGMYNFSQGSRGYIIIPSEFAYGSTGSGSIPPNTTLVFQIQMLAIKPAE